MLQIYMERVVELSYNSSDPLQFNQIDCSICLDNFENNQTLVA